MFVDRPDGSLFEEEISCFRRQGEARYRVSEESK